MTDEARAADSPPRSAVHIPNPTYLYVIFDGPPGPESGRFVEVEDENGQGVSAGNWEGHGDGFWTLGPFLQPPAEVAEEPGETIDTMMEVILRRALLMTTKGGTYHDWYVAVKDIYDTAQRLKTALAQREGEEARLQRELTIAADLLRVEREFHAQREAVMEEMAKALESRAVAAHGHLEEAGVRHEHSFRECEHPACLDARVLADQYRAVRR